MAGLSPKMRLTLFIGVPVVLLVLILLWFFSTHERINRMQPLPLTGEAAYNPFYALKRTLERSGLTVQSEASLRLEDLDLKPGETLVIGGRPEHLTQAELEQIETWVRSGGHVMLALQQTRDLSFSEMLKRFLDQMEDAKEKAEELQDKQRQATEDKNSSAPADAPEDDDSPFDAAEISEKDKDKEFEELRKSDLVKRYQLFITRSSGCLSLDALDSKVSSFDFCPELRFYLPDSESQDVNLEFDWRLGNEDEGFALAKSDFGSGSMLFISDMRWLATYQLRDGNMKPMVRQLFDAPIQRGKRVIFIYGSRMPSLMVIIVEKGWPLLLPLLLALLFWALKRSARFGPLLAHTLAPRRALKEHVLAAGEFLFRRQRGQALHQALLNHTYKRMLRKHPQLETLEFAERVNTVAQLYNIDQKSVLQALSPVELDKPHSFIQSIKTLILLRK